MGGPAQREGGRPAQREREGTTHRGGSCTKRGVDRPAQREGDLHREREGTTHRGGSCTKRRLDRPAQRERGRETCTERERELPTEGDPAQKGGGVGRPAQREGETCTERGRDLHREREGATHRGGPCTKRGVDRPAQREGDLHRERERGNYPQRGILHKEGGI